MYRSLEPRNIDDIANSSAHYGLPMVEKMAGLFSYNEILSRSAEIAAKELRVREFSIYRLSQDKKRLCAVGMVLSPTRKFDFYKILKKRFESLSTPVDTPENLMGRTVNEKKIFIGNYLYEFVAGVVPKVVSDTISKFFKDEDSTISLPCMSRGEVWGAILASFSSKEFPGDDLVKRFEPLANAMGLAMANAAAHERVIERFKMLYRQRGLRHDTEKADIKFTLRITQKIEKYLAWKTQNTAMAKADYLRERIEEEMAQDRDFRRLMGEKMESDEGEE